MAERVTHVTLGARVGGYVKDVLSAGKATDDLRTKAERFSRGKYDAKLGLNTAKARTDLSALERQLQAFGKSTTEKRVNLNTLEAEARALALQERLEALGTKVTDAQVDVDDSKAQAKLSHFEAQLLAIGERSATADLDLKGVATAEAQLGVLEAQLADFDRKRYEAHVGVSGAEGATKQTSFLVDSLLMLGPAAVPIGAALVPAVAALSSGLAAAAVGGGALVLAFKGIGKALTAVNNYALAPTDAHLQAMQQALQGMGPAGRDFVMFLQSLRPKLQQVQELARAGLFPGLEAGISSALDALPQVERLISGVSAALGNMAASAGAALDSPYWKNFIGWLSNEAPVVLAGVSRALGNLAHGFAGVMVALDPMARSFGSALGRMAQEFAQWGQSLATSKGFHDFVSYVEQAGPRVADLLGALAQAIVAIAKAAAPVGAATLPLLTALAKALTVIADSPAGPALFAAAAGLAAVNRALRTMEAVQKMPVFEKLGASLENITRRQLLTRSAAGIAGVGLAMASMGEHASTSGKVLSTFGDTASGALIGFSAGGPIGAAIGGGAGLLVGLGQAFLGSSHSADQASAANQQYISTLNQVSGAITKTTREMVTQTLEQQGALKQIAQLGLDPSLGLQAVLGPNRAAATDQITAAYNRQIGALQAHSGAQVKDVTSGLNLIYQTKDLTDKKKALLAILGVETGKVRGSQSAFDREKDALDGVTGASGRASGATRGYGDSVNYAKRAVDQFTTDLDTLLGKTLGLEQATVAWKSSIRTLTSELKGGTDALNINTKKGQENRQALDQRVQALQSMVDRMHDAGASEAEMGRALQHGAHRILEAGKAANISASDMRGYLHELGLTPKQIRTLIRVDARQAFLALDGVKAGIAAVHSKTVYLDIVRRDHNLATFAPPPGSAPGSGHGADGTTVPKDGRPYADRYLYMLAPGEEVITNRHGEADRFRAMRAAGMIPGLAGGGTAGLQEIRPVPIRMSSAAAPTRVVVQHTFPTKVQLVVGGRAFDAHIKTVASETYNEHRAYDHVTGGY